MNVNDLEKSLSMTFTNHSLITQAFIHSSYVNEHHDAQLEDNERLEFLGDAVLELIISEHLYKTYPEMPEGEMSKLRSRIVREEALFYYAEKLHLHKYVLLGKGEERTGGRKRQALLADVFEAFLGALYLDQGFNTCRNFIKKYVVPLITDDVLSHMMDFKTKLQELIQRDKDGTLHYQIIDEQGPSHRKLFVAEVIVNDELRTTGKGYTKKEAEQVAAKNMLKRLNELGHDVK